jgi:tetratricopeptide (TPR) repeat protein
VLCRLGRPDDGQRAYRKALDLDPADETACFVLCHLLEHRAQIAESVLLLRRFAAENPTEVKLCLHLARLLERTGDRDGAVDAYRDVLVRDPANPDARGALARLSPPSWASGWTGAPPVARSANTLPSLAVITMVYNESDFLPIWLRHYSRAVGAENCFILDHGSDDDSTANLAPVNVIRVPRSPHDNQRRAAAMSDLASSLLRWYDFVAYTDADEMLVAHPGRFESLRHFCARMTAGTTTAFGLNVLHRLEKDGPLDPAAAISLQRGWAFPLSSMAKPILTSEPVRWVPGFHSYNGPPRFDGLFNFHLAYADRSLALRRQAKRRASPIKVKPNDPVHHHLASDEAVLNWMAVWSQLPERHDTTLDAHCPAYSEFVTKIIESYARCKNHTMKIDLGLWGDALWRIPDGFLQTF